MTSASYVWDVGFIKAASKRQVREFFTNSPSVLYTAYSVSSCPVSRSIFSKSHRKDLSPYPASLRFYSSKLKIWLLLYKE